MQVHALHGCVCVPISIEENLMCRAVNMKSVAISRVRYISLVRWCYLRCCDFDDFSPSFPIYNYA